MASAMQYLDDVLTPEVRSLLSEQVRKRRAAQENLVANPPGVPVGPSTGGAAPPPIQGAQLSSGPKAWFDQRMAEAHPGWKVDQMLRDKGLGIGGRLRGALDPAFAARTLAR